MATIQIRDVPESSYEMIRRRSRAAGQSIQAYMRQQVIEMTKAPSKAEALSAIEDSLAKYGPARTSVAQIIDDLDADRR